MTTTIKGYVKTKKSQTPLSGLLVEIWDKDVKHNDLLGQTVTDAKGYFEWSISDKELQARCRNHAFKDPYPDIFFKVYQAKELLASTAHKPIRNMKKPVLDVSIEVPDDAVEPVVNQTLVEGQIFLDNGLPAKKLSIKLYSKAFGGAAKVIGSTQTDATGRYKLTTDQALANFEIRAGEDKKQEVTLSALKYNPSKHEVVNLVAPTSLQPQGTEFERLTKDLTQQLGKCELKEAREDDQVKDLTLLHQATGWDARLIALAATAEQMSEATHMPAEALYALFRAGFPTDKQALASSSSSAVSTAIEKANEALVTKVSAQAAVKAFEKFRQEERWSSKQSGTLGSAQALLAIAALSDSDAKNFEAAYKEHTGDSEALWQAARAKGVSDKSIAKLQQQGKLAYLTSNNVPLMQALDKEVGSPEKLAEKGYFKAEQWKSTLKASAKANGIKVGTLIPDTYQGATTAKKLNAYASDLANTVRLSYPNQVVKSLIDDTKNPLLGQANRALSKDVSTVLGNLDILNKTLQQQGREAFVLGRAPLNAFLQEHEEVLFERTTAAKKPALTEELKKLHRLYQVTPTTEALQAAYALGFNAAQDIVAFKQDEFVANYRSNFSSEEDARLTYQKAAQVNAIAQNIYSMGAYASIAPPLYATSGTGDEQETVNAYLIKRFPTLESLFGSVDFCECQHCRSILSPAAYLVDLLQFIDLDEAVWANRNRGLSKPDGTPYQKPYDVFQAKRPDILHTLLTCENTHTVLPYIDLVNETLEYYIAENGLDASAAKDNAGATTEELLAEPQYVAPKAYQHLSEAAYPLNLPFDLWLETARKFIEKSKTALWQVADAFRPTNALFPASTQPYGRAAILAERLHISPTEYLLLTAHEASQWYALYGFSSAAQATTEAYDDHNQRIDLHSAKALSRRLGVTYKELDALTQTQFVRLGVLDKGVYLKPEEEGCDFNKTLIRYADDTPADDFLFYKLNIFVRLWKKLGWTMQETDQALTHLWPQATATTLNTLGEGLKTVLIGLAHIKALTSQLSAARLTPQALMALWTDMGTVGEDSLYSTLFLGTDLVSDYPIFKEKGSQGQYLTSNERLEAYLLPVQGVLQLTHEEIEHILATDNTTLPTAKLNLANLSLLYRYKLLSEALQLSVQDLITVQALSGIDPFQALDPRAVDSTDAAGHLLHTGAPEARYAPEQTLHFVETVQQLKASGFTVAEFNYIVQHQFDPVGKFEEDDSVTQALIQAIEEEHQRLLAEHPGQTATIVEERANALIRFIEDTLSSKLAVELDLLKLLLTTQDWADLVQHLQNAAQTEASLLLNRIAKALMVVQAFKVTNKELRLLNAPTHQFFGGLDLRQLPIAPVTDASTATTLFLQLLRLANYSELKQGMAGGKDDLADILEAASSGSSLPALTEQLAVLTRRDSATMTALAEQLDLQTPNDWADERNLARLWQAMQLVTALGVPITTIREVTTLLTITELQAARQANDAPRLEAWYTERARIAHGMKNAIKARFATAAWHSIAKAVFDPLRQMKRDALVAHIMHIRDFDQEAQLFEYFLLDPGMEPVVKTSRIRLAITSVQLFIQRCLLNLEKDVHPAAIDTKQWEWMKRYRVWEANRKIFLYPENWMEPELRDDKTHLFEALEGELLQGDVSKELVEKAFFKYLKGLEEIARLQIVTTYYEEVADATQNVLHVLARTYHQPYAYYYRRYANGLWTPWEPVSAKVEGNHVVMIKWQDRIHLFWATFLEQAAEQDSANDMSIEEMAKNKPSELAPNKRVEVQLNWSDYYQGQWANQATTGFNKTMVIDNVGTSFDAARVYIHASKELDNAGKEIAVKVNLSHPVSKAFRLTSKVGSPQEADRGLRILSPYDIGREFTETYIKGVGSLDLFNVLNLNTNNQVSYEDIIQLASDQEAFSLVVANTTTTQGTFRFSVGRSIDWLFAYTVPFFFQDDQNTFLVMPHVKRIGVMAFEGWASADLLTSKISPLHELTPIVPVANMADVLSPQQASMTVDKAAKYKIRTGTFLTRKQGQSVPIRYQNSPIGYAGELTADMPTRTLDIQHSH